MQFTAEERPIGRREAKRTPTLINQYREQKGESLSEDMASRGGWATSRRPFVGWDSEGYTLPDGSHHMMLFGASSGEYIAGESLGTRACLDLMLRVEENEPDVFHVIFAGNYDVNMMLRDLPKVKLQRLQKTNHCEWGEYRLQYIRNKWFKVTRGSVSVTLYDVFTFFGTSFVKALQDYLGADNEDVQRIIAGKKLRDQFSLSDLSTVREYWETELQYLVKLCQRLRAYLHSAGIRISRWHGPGAVASATLRQRGFKRLPSPEAVDLASQYAYFGGRFEAPKLGIYNGPVYQYDIRSAYPAAIATLPSLTGTWTEYDHFRPDMLRDFSLYYVTVAPGLRPDVPLMGPFPWRRKNGMVYYPLSHGGTWIWGVELRAALGTMWADFITVHRCLLYENRGESRPFKWIADMYDERRVWIANGNPAQLALKLAMNSIYGKLAQQTGSSFDSTKGWKIPVYHQLEYAGYITAFTRAILLSAISQAGSSAIATETDAIFSTTPLKLPIGSRLGEWEEQTYEGICYLQSGLYFARELSGEWKPRTRGFTRNKVNPQRVFRYLSCIQGYDAVQIPFTVTEKRFRTMGTSIGKPEWRRWVKDPRQIRIGVPGGKREHYPYPDSCSLCSDGPVPYSAGLHDTIPALDDPSTTHDYTLESTRHPLVWKGDPPKEYVDEPEDVEDWQVFA